MTNGRTTENGMWRGLRNGDLNGLYVKKGGEGVYNFKFDDFVFP